jgi:hypothetical protein
MSVNVASRCLRDFSYLIGQRRGVIYFVTNYSFVERLIREMSELRELRLYLLGCSETLIDGDRLRKNLFSHLPHLTEFNFFFQSYGRTQQISMEDFSEFGWNFAYSSHQLTDMSYLFTVPYSFPYLHQCVNEHFFPSIQTTNPFSKSSSLLFPKELKIISFRESSSAKFGERFRIWFRERFISFEFNQCQAFRNAQREVRLSSFDSFVFSIDECSFIVSMCVSSSSFSLGFNFGIIVR